MSKYYERRLSEFDIDPKIIINKEINCIETGAAIDFSDFINLFDKNKHITSNVAKANLDISFSEVIYRSIKESKLSQKFIYDLRFWQWICINPLKEYCIWRWDIDTSSNEPQKSARFIGGGGVTGFSKNTISRLYIPAELLINEPSTEDLVDGDSLFQSFWSNQQKELSICQSVLSMNKDIFIAAVRCVDGLDTKEISRLVADLNFRSSSYFLDAMSHEEIYEISNN
jgi:hypothetical protein